MRAAPVVSSCDVSVYLACLHSLPLPLFSLPLLRAFPEQPKQCHQVIQTPQKPHSYPDKNDFNEVFGFCILTPVLSLKIAHIANEP